MVPWFILGFVAMVALASEVRLTHGVNELISGRARRLLAVKLFLIGANMSRPALAAVSWRSFFLVFGTSNISPLTCDLLPRRLLSTAVGLGNSANCLAGGAGVTLTGILKSHVGLGGVFGGISGMIVISIVALVAAYAFFLKRDLARWGEKPRDGSSKR